MYVCIQRPYDLQKLKESSSKHTADKQQEWEYQCAYVCVRPQLFRADIEM